MTLTTTAPMMLAALEWAERGLPIVSTWHVADGRCGCRAMDCERPGKHPIASNAPHGWQSATLDPATLRVWWACFPLANIATATEGHRVVLDVDPRHGGDTTLARLMDEHRPLPCTPKVWTPSGGWHLHFAWRPLKSRSGHVGAGLDIKAGGSLAALPPSCGLAGVYREDPDAGFELPLAPLPAWLVALASAELARTGASAPRTTDEWAAKLAGAPEGQRREAALEIAGHYLRLLGPEREAEVTMILVGHAALCSPPFPESEARAIVRDLARRDRDRLETAPVTTGVDWGDDRAGVRAGPALHLHDAAPARPLRRDFIRYGAECVDGAHEHLESTALILLATATPGLRARLRQYPRGLPTAFYAINIGVSTRARRAVWPAWDWTCSPMPGPCFGGCAADELVAGRVPEEHQRAKRRCPPRTPCASGHGRSSLPQRWQLATNTPMAEPHLGRKGL